MTAEIVDFHSARLDRMTTDELFIHMGKGLAKLQDWNIRQEMNWLETLRASPHEDAACTIMARHLVEIKFAAEGTLAPLAREELIATVEADYLRYRTLQLQFLKERYGDHPTLKEFGLIKSV